MKKSTRLILIGLAALFGLLFLLRFGYELSVAQAAAAAAISQGNFEPQPAMAQDISSSGKRGVNNYASSKIIIKQAAAADQVIDQKYERVANLAAHSAEFDADTEKLVALEKDLNAVVQQENSAGLKGSRHLELALGVVPASFETLVAKLKDIAKLDSISVNKTDKTADFKALAAKRLSLEKTRDGLRALKVPGAALSDLIQLETRILEIEGQIQDLGVSLGDFDETNSLCTVHFSLLETKPVPGPNVLIALLDALAWTLPIYLGLVFAAALALLTAVLASIVIEKIRAWSATQLKPAAAPPPAPIVPETTPSNPRKPPQKKAAAGS